MRIQYENESDTLTIRLTPERREVREARTGDLHAGLDQDGALTRITVERASHFLVAALAAYVGVEEEEGEPPRDRLPPGGTTWYTTESSMLSGYGYNPDEEILDVAFKKGMYRYYGVPLDVFSALHEAESKGRYMNQHIIGVYPSDKA